MTFFLTLDEPRKHYWLQDAQPNMLCSHVHQPGTTSSLRRRNIIVHSNSIILIGGGGVVAGCRSAGVVRENYQRK